MVIGVSKQQNFRGQAASVIGDGRALEIAIGRADPCCRAIDVSRYAERPTIFEANLFREWAR